MADEPGLPEVENVPGPEPGAEEPGLELGDPCRPLFTAPDSTPGNTGTEGDRKVTDVSVFRIVSNGR